MSLNRASVWFPLASGLCMAGLVALGSGCAEQPAQPPAEQATAVPASAAAAATDAQQTFVVQVPDAGDAAVNRIIVQSLKAGIVDGPTQKVLNLLGRPATQPFELTIEGENLALNAATLDRALRNLKAPVSAPCRIVIDAIQEQLAPLQPLAEQKGVTLVIRDATE